jgi:adenosylcobinamide-GDP ribazoletransferase
MTSAPEKSAPQPLTALLIAVQFLTVSPAFIRRTFTDKELGQSVAYFPLVGLLLGGILIGLHTTLLHIFPPLVTAVLVLSSWIAITGALHLDGFLDAMDGLFGGATPDKRLEIMKDERIGAFAFAGGALLLLLKFAALVSLVNPLPVLLLAPTIGRWIIALAIISFPYGRTQGLGRAMKDHAGPGAILLATLTTLLVAWLTTAGWGLLGMGFTALLITAVLRFVLQRIPGLTGDIYGAICELGETVVLLIFVVKA